MPIYNFKLQIDDSTTLGSLLMERGTISGSDHSGAQYVGTYELDDASIATITAAIMTPAKVKTDTDAAAPRKNTKISASVKFPLTPGDIALKVGGKNATMTIR